jgi:hypothetical protein
MVKKLALVLALLMFSSPVFAQALGHPDDAIVTDKWCDDMVYVLKENAKNYARPLTKEDLKKQFKERDLQLVRLSHASTAYKNLCKGSVYKLIKDTLKKLMPAISQ